MTDDLKEQFAAAKSLILEKRYSEARQLLKRLNHPRATEWLSKLDELDPPRVEQPPAPIQSPAYIPPTPPSITPPPPAETRSPNRLMLLLGVGGLLSFGLIAVILFFIFGNKPDTPVEKVKAVFAALNEGNLEKAAQYVCPEGRGELTTTLDEMTRNAYTYEVVSVVQEGDVVRYVVRFDQPGGLFDGMDAEGTFYVIDGNLLCEETGEDTADSDAEIAATEEGTSGEGGAAAETTVESTESGSGQDQPTADPNVTAAPNPTAAATAAPTGLALDQLSAINSGNAAQLQTLSTSTVFESTVAWFDRGGRFAVVLDKTGYFAEGYAPQIHIYDIATMTEIQTLSPDARSFMQVALSPSGNLVAASDPFGSIWVWDTQTWTQKFVLTAFEDSFEGSSTDELYFTQDDQLLVSGHSSQGVIVWEMTTGTQKAMLHDQVHNATAVNLSLSPTGNVLVFADEFDVLLWNPATVTAIEPPDGTDPPAVVSPNGQIIASLYSPDRQYRIKLHQADTLAPLGELPLGEDDVDHLVFSSDSTRLLVIDREQTLRVFDTVTSTLIAEFAFGNDLGFIDYATFSPDNSLISLVMDDQAVLLDGQSLAQVMLLPHPDLKGISFSADGKLIMLSGSELQLWGLAP